MDLNNLFFLTGSIFFILVIFILILFTIVMWRIYFKTSEQIKKFTTFRGFWSNLRETTKPINLLIIILSAVFTYFIKKRK
ncbi:MAG: hypothetical protein KatS3mg090_0764 [Patescibacteria group bacterium]|nr:MAG: hypothetical protein KatS3mg090_0764 [Patescibacteria group bacterium]